MKALFQRTYDYYEWDNFIIASDDYDKLKNYYEKKCEQYPLISDDEYKSYYNNEKAHYIIKDIKVI